jgi:hypothetical protein
MQGQVEYLQHSGFDVTGNLLPVFATASIVRVSSLKTCSSPLGMWRFLHRDSEGRLADQRREGWSIEGTAPRDYRASFDKIHTHRDVV